ncbi:hypothetical protein HJD18_05355 [Thermoleophilia bacterium SCSIO 60948]|nr:hypothetical protein HJD18_05355 [Thermoleophilia bacterium SCSIO 60948]
MATLALVVAMAGGAYAVTQFGTRDVKNNSLRSADLKNRKAVTGRDIRRNSLSGAEILESGLETKPLVQVSGDGSGVCDPEDGIPQTCAKASVGLPRRSNLLVTVTGGFTSTSGTPASASCAIEVDGRPPATLLNPGEANNANTSPTATNGFAGTYLPDSPVSAGMHDVALTCTQIGSADAVIEDPSIAVIAVAAP